jgi:hypothetical protein
MSKAKPKKLTVMVSSTVYGIEELLDRIYSLLTAYGYEVWMSHKGTLPVVSDRTAFENCLAAVEKCDLFLGLITPQYGSGRKGLTLKKSQILDDLRAWTSTKKRLATKRIYLIASATGCKSFARLTMAHCLSVLSSIVIRRWKTSFVRTLRADHLSILREVKHDKRRHSKTVGAGRRTTN